MSAPSRRLLQRAPRAGGGIAVAPVARKDMREKYAAPKEGTASFLTDNQEVNFALVDHYGAYWRLIDICTCESAQEIQGRFVRLLH